MATVRMSAGRVRPARNAVHAVFAVNGFLFASWAGRLPDTKALLGLSAGAIGTLLLFMSVASVAALPLAGRISTAVGVDGAVRLGAAVSLTGVAVIAAGIDVLSAQPVVAAGLALYGLGMGVWDVAMNLEGAAVERLLGRTVMPHFHAAFSGGTVAGGLVAAGLSRFDVPVGVHLVAAAALVGVVVVWATGRFLPRGLEDHGDEPGTASAVGAGAERSAWFEPRTLLIGFVVFVAAFTEGTANDWLAIAVVEGHHTERWLGILAFAVFLAAMTAGRVVGTRLLDRHGRVPVLRVLFGTAIAGSLLVVFGTTWLAFVGALVWGVGASMGFPVGMSASADDPRRAAARMSVVSTIGYGAFLAGPPFLGYLGDNVGVLRSLLVLSVLVVLALLALPAVREPGKRATSGSPREARGCAQGEHDRTGDSPAGLGR